MSIHKNISRDIVYRPPKNKNMKKVIITAIFALGLVFSSNAQSDGFFTYKDVETRETSMETDMPALPISHGLGNDQSSVPLGNGLLLLAAFAMLRLKRNDK